MATETTTAELTELAAYIHETVETVSRPKQARITLVHIHLPKLAEHEIIDYDERSEIIRYRDGKRLEHLLEIIDSYTATN
ncbi:hypothetical protein A4G99_16560 [Haladaptatus sp. R4]|nr:hypothetical protein A4G99_16560 [Haladaptatus sp. R4]